MPKKSKRFFFNILLIFLVLTVVAFLFGQNFIGFVVYPGGTISAEFYPVRVLNYSLANEYLNAVNGTASDYAVLRSSGDSYFGPLANELICPEGTYKEWNRCSIFTPTSPGQQYFGGWLLAGGAFRSNITNSGTAPIVKHVTSISVNASELNLGCINCSLSTSYYAFIFGKCSPNSGTHEFNESKFYNLGACRLRDNATGDVCRLSSVFNEYNYSRLVRFCLGFDVEKVLIARYPFTDYAPDPAIHWIALSNYTWSLSGISEDFDPCSEISCACNDNEFEPNPNIRGTVTINSSGVISTVSDSCASDIRVLDHYCGAVDLPTYNSIRLNCQRGQTCSNGVCVARRCTDSDEGVNINVRGEVNVTSTTGFTAIQDRCWNVANVIEYYCNVANYLSLKRVSCPSGTACVDGACITNK